MDLILGVLDPHFFTPYVYPASLTPDNPVRQAMSVFSIICVGGSLLYLIPATLAYFFLFDHRLMQHPKWIPGQVGLEIRYALWSVPWMALPTTVIFVAELQGYSKLYDKVEDHPWGWAWIFITIPLFLLFTDFCIYWIHRWLHHPILYGPIHKPHHRWLVCSPFASHAFHPIDGFSQSAPYHIYAFIFPMHKLLYLALFITVNIWSTSIHDECYLVPKFLQPFINGSAHHTDHHLYFDYNFGQYFTLWDRIGGSFRDPSAYVKGESIFDDLDRCLAERAKKEKAQQKQTSGSSSDDKVSSIHISKDVPSPAAKKSSVRSRKTE